MPHQNEIIARPMPVPIFIIARRENFSNFLFYIQVWAQSQRDTKFMGGILSQKLFLFLFKLSLGLCLATDTKKKSSEHSKAFFIFFHKKISFMSFNCTKRDEVITIIIRFNFVIINELNVWVSITNDNPSCHYMMRKIYSTESLSFTLCKITWFLWKKKLIINQSWICMTDEMNFIMNF